MVKLARLCYHRRRDKKWWLPRWLDRTLPVAHVHVVGDEIDRELEELDEAEHAEEAEDAEVKVWLRRQLRWEEQLEQLRVEAGVAAPKPDEEPEAPTEEAEPVGPPRSRALLALGDWRAVVHGPDKRIVSAPRPSPTHPPAGRRR